MDVKSGFVILLHVSHGYCYLLQCEYSVLNIIRTFSRYVKKSVCAAEAEKLFLSSCGYYCWPLYSSAYCLHWRWGNDCVIFCNSC